MRTACDALRERIEAFQNLVHQAVRVGDLRQLDPLN